MVTGSSTGTETIFPETSSEAHRRQEEPPLTSPRGGTQADPPTGSRAHALSGDGAHASISTGRREWQVASVPQTSQRPARKPSSAD